MNNDMPSMRSDATASDLRDTDARATSTDETRTLISANKVQGTPVYNTAQERLGTIDSIMLGKFDGKVAYAIMSFGGFLGIGERYHPLPWSVLDYDINQGGYCIDMSADVLKNAPNYTRDEVDTLDYDAQGSTIDNYYADPSNYAKRGGTMGSSYRDPASDRDRF